MGASLPSIDISPFLAEDSTLQSLDETGTAIHRACCETGFFYLTGHGIPALELEQVLRVTRTFLLDGSEEEKEKLSISKNDGARGYQRIGDNVTSGAPDWHEALDLYAPAPSTLHGPILSGTNQFPSKPLLFQPVLEQWVLRLRTLGRALMRATAMGLKMTPDETEKLLDQVADSFWYLRCIGYPPLPSTHEGVSCGAHKDYGCFTFLHTDSTQGSLQVSVPEKGGQGCHWIEANPIDGAFVVNIGEMWETWTNGLYKATLHRVIHRSNNYRVSIPFFFEPAFETVVAPLPAAIRLQEETLRKYNKDDRSSVQVVKEPVHYGNFLIGKISGNFSTARPIGQISSRY